MAYRIVKWEEAFEVSESRRTVHPRWLPVPTTIGSGLMRLLSERDGATAYGIFLLVAAQIGIACPTRGDLVDGRGQPWTDDMIAFAIRRPSAEVSKCLRVLVNVGWLEIYELPGQDPGDTRVTPGLEERRGEEKRREESARAGVARATPRALFTPPTEDEAREFFSAQGVSGNHHLKFLAHYVSNGWKVGKNPMKRWKAAAAGWILRGRETGEIHA